jgi:chromosome partitioning protein
LRTIAVLNQKGGVGKTTTTANTAAALAALGQKVIVMDLDPQAHLTIHLGVEPQSVHPGSYEVLTQSAALEESLMMVRPNLWLLGANINLVGAETELVNVVGREIILREAMQGSQDRFDFCLIDCAPSLGLLSLNALAASQEVLIPLQPHFLALQGFGKLLQTVDLVNKRINPSLKVSGVLLCMFDTRASLPNEVRADIERFLNNARGSASAWADAQLVPTFIRRNIKLAEAPSYGQTVFEYDPTCNGAEDYRRVAEFFLGIEPESDVESQLEEETEPQAEIVPETEAAIAEEAPEVWEPEPGEQAVEEPSVGKTESAPWAEPPMEPAPVEPEAVASPEEMREPATAEGESFPLDGEAAPADEVEAIVESELESLAGGHTEQTPSWDESQAPVESERDSGTQPSVEAEPQAWVEPTWESSEGEHRDQNPAETQSGTEAEQGPPSGGESEPEGEPQAQDDSSNESTPIEIREFQPPMPRRYSPPPLKTYPIPPSQRVQEPESQDEGPSEQSDSQS